MAKCKWCEDEIPLEKGNFCSRNCEGMFDIFRIRSTIHNLSIDMELAMQEKDNLGYTNKDKSLNFLVEKLKEEREEVNNELDYLPSDSIDKELLHEAIMVMLVRQRLKEYGKHAKLDME